MSAQRLALIRHGDYAQRPETPSALQPYPLTAKGEAGVRAEAHALGDWLARSRWRLHNEIHCSTLLRAWQTADIYRQELAPFFAMPPSLHSVSALCERSVGALANLSVSEIEHIVAQDPRLAALPAGWKSASHFKLPFEGAESLLDAGERVARHLQTLTPAEEGHLALIVGHGAAIRHACYHLNIISFNDIARLSMFHGHPVVFERQTDGWVRLYGNWKHRQAADPLD